MRSLHLVIPDLLLPKQLAEYAGKDLPLPALEKLLARATVNPIPEDTLESWLCRAYGVDEHAIAPVTLLADGMDAGGDYWLRADPVGLVMQQTRMVLQADVELSAEEAAQLCASLNRHFADDGMQFAAPHPQRWYLRLQEVPQLVTQPLSQVLGGDMHAHLPEGRDALHWHGVLNEIQMLLFAHEVNQAREQRGVPAVSGVWLWGGGYYPQALPQAFAAVLTDSDLARAFAQASGALIVESLDWQALTADATLLVCQEGLRNALHRADIQRWRSALQALENDIFKPALAALAQGKIGQIALDTLIEGGARRFVVKRADLWKFWRFSMKLQHYAALIHPSGK